jgi:hypothetical protein
MPEISRFLGVIIYMYFNDHNPPHFHVKYKKYRAAIDIKHAQIIEGHLPKKIFTIIKKWTIINEEQLIKIGSL